MSRRCRLAGAVSPVVIRAAGLRAQAVVCGRRELPCLLAGQLRMVVHQARGDLSTRHHPNPQSPAHAVAVFQHRRIRSGDARRACGGQEVRDGLGLRHYRAGAKKRRGQAYGNGGSSATDEDLANLNGLVVR